MTRYLDDDGFLFLNDRANDMIIVGGLNIYPAEIEGALVQHEAVGDVAVFGIPNPDVGEEIRRSSNYAKAGSRPTRPPRRS